MKKRPLLGMFAFMVLGILLGRVIWGSLIVTALIFIGVIVRKRQPLLICLCTIGVLLGFLQGTAYDKNYNQQSSMIKAAENEGSTIVVKGMIRNVVIGEASVKYELSHCIRMEKDTSKPSLGFIVYQKKQKNMELSKGSFIIVKGVPASFARNRNDGGFNEESYGYGNCMVGKFLTPKIEIQNIKGVKFFYGKVLEKLDGVRQALCVTYFDNLKDEDAGILATMSLGKKDAVSKEIRNKFGEAGIAHVLAISGVHISILGMAFFEFFQKRKAGLYLSCILSSIFVVLFLITTGAGTSSFRAVIMYIIFLISMMLGTSYDGFSAIALTGVIILFIWPSSLFCAAFQYSFAAVMGVFSAKEVLQLKYKKIHPLWASLLISCSTWLCTLPLVAWYQFQVPLASMILNLLIIPLVAPILIFGFVGGVVTLWGGSVIPIGCFQIVKLLLYFMKGLASVYVTIPCHQMVVGA